jgi:cell division protein FtsB
MVSLAAEPRLGRWMPARSPRWQRWALRMALATGLAVGLAYLPYRLLDGDAARKAQSLREQHQRAVAGSRVLAEENERLRYEIEALKSDASAIEDIAREELGMVRPGEIILRMEEAPAP